MQRKQLITLLLLSLGLFSMAQPPRSYTIVTEDIARFWAAYGNGDTTGLAQRLQTQYIDKATPGLKSFLPGRVGSAHNLARVIKAHPKYYAALRSRTALLEGYKAAIDSAFQRMLAIYPQAQLPTVYFVVGAMNSGGTSSDAGLIIGADMYGRTPATDTTELGKWHKQVLNTVEVVPSIVAHEMVHFLQKGGDKEDLLHRCLQEGMADFIGQLISPGNFNDYTYRWAVGKEKMLWQWFTEDRQKNDMARWLYNGTNAQGYAPDLGYWMGYQICKAYYDKAADKKQAVYDMLHLQDAQAFLDASAYARQFE